MKGRKVAPYMVAISLLVGCSGEGDQVAIHIPSERSAPATAQEGGEGPAIAILRFRDVRRDQPLLGTRMGRFGFLDTYSFGVSGGDVGLATSEAMRKFLRAHGSHVVEGMGIESDADVVVRAEVRQLSVRGVNNWFTTTLTCSVNLLVSGENLADGSQVSLPVAAERSREVRWFDTRDVEDLVNQVIEESFGQLLGATRFEGKQLVAVRR